MSEPPRTLSSVMGIDAENALLDWLSLEGVTVRDAHLPTGVWGLYDRGEANVYLQVGMPACYRLPVLLHEAHHVRRGDAGHQARRVEDFIDEAVATTLIDLQDYRDAESHFGASTAGIAAELAVPKWLVRSYKRVLARTVMVGLEPHV